MRTKKYTALVAATALTGALPQIAHAQTSDDAEASSAPNQGIEEIVVTAEKRSESLLRTPISLVAMSQETLKKEGIGTLGDIRSSVPGLAISKFVSSPQTLQAYIRGQGVYDNQITFDPAVSTNFNGVYIGRTAGLAFEIPGVERIEVLRGPQGTLYGRNATGGAINIITVKPKLKQFSGEATIGYGNYNAFKASGAFDVPIIEDMLGVRIAGLVTRRDGWVKNTGLGEDFAKIEAGALRADIRFKPAENVTIDYGYDLSIDNGTAPFIQNLGGNPVRQNGIEFGGTIYTSRTKSVEAPFALPHNHSRASGHTITAEWAASDAFTVRSITAWREARALAFQQSAGGATPLAPFGYPVLSYPSNPLLPNMPGRFVLQAQRQDDANTQFSQELNLLGEAFDSHIKYTFGFFYFNESGSSNQTGILGPGGLTHAIPLPRNSPPSTVAAWARDITVSSPPAQHAPRRHRCNAGARR